MSLKKDFISTRFDKATKVTLLSLVNDLDFNKSEIIRHAVRTFGELVELKKQQSELLTRTREGQEKTFILVSS